MSFFQELTYVGLLVLGVIATFATAALFLWLCHFSRFSHFIHTLSNLSPQVVAIVGILFALYTTFFASDIWNIRDRAQTAIQHESEAMRRVFRLAEQQPPEIGDPIMKALRDYAHTVVEIEWPLLAQGESGSTDTVLAWRRLFSVSLSAHVTQKMPTSVHAFLLQGVDQIASARHQRLAQSQKHGDPLKWFAVACLGALTLLTVALVHLENWRTQWAALLIYASAISISFAAAYLQRSPFQVFVVSVQPIAEFTQITPDTLPLLP